MLSHLHPAPARPALFITLLAATGFIPAFASAAENTADSERRLADATRYLSSDELEGRGIGTGGLDKAADYIAAQFAAEGLKTDLYNGTPFQRFTMVASTELGEKSSLAFVPPSGAEAKAIEPPFREAFRSAAPENLTRGSSSSDTESRRKTRATTITRASTSKGKPSSSCGTSRNKGIRTAFSTGLRTRHTRRCGARSPTPTSMAPSPWC